MIEWIVTRGIDCLMCSSAIILFFVFIFLFLVHGRSGEIEENRKRGCECEHGLLWVAVEKDCPVHGAMARDDR